MHIALEEFGPWPIATATQTDARKWLDACQNFKPTITFRPLDVAKAVFGYEPPWRLQH
jgi:hypothetical protein